jgi:hypothetical protein
MSDGPYRSLPMSASWKRVAQCGEKDAFEIGDISAALVPALAGDWRTDVQPSFLDQLIAVVTQQETLLFQETFAGQLEALRSVAGCGLGRRLLDLTLLALESGERGIAALKLGAKDALYDQASRRARQMEEHYLREANRQTASDVRRKIEGGIMNAPLESLAHKVVDGEAAPRKVKVEKFSGLDDGVML